MSLRLTFCVASKCNLSVVVAYLVCMCLLGARVDAAVIRVNGATGNDANNGASWQLAKKTVTSALATSVYGDEIWVAAGTYVERINLKNGVALYGGFNGTETARVQRDWLTNKSILDGNQGGHVVTSSAHLAPTARIDGFTIRNASGRGIDCITSSPTITNNTITANNGGGIYCQSSHPAITNNTITTNSGRGIYCWSSNPTIANNTIILNGASSALDGIYCEGSNPTITNNTITANQGSGINCLSSSPSITNNTITGNYGGGIRCNYSSPIVTNNILAFNSIGIVNHSVEGTPTLRNNCVFGNVSKNYTNLAAGTGDISVDPKLEDWRWGKVHIQPDSPCRDGGYDEAVGTGWLDMDGQARVQGAHVDIGADESDGTLWPAFVPGIVYVKTDGSDSNDGSSWAQAKKTVQAGIDAATVIKAQLWVKAGVYNERTTLKYYVEMYGGFDGTETALSQRSWTANPTVLDGQQGGSVVTASTALTASRIDGFTIRNGNATYGGGIYCFYSSPTIINNIITGNSASFGGGIDSTFSSPSIISNTITENSALNNGGAIICVQSSATIINNTIVANSAPGDGGGVYCTYYSDPIISNNIIAFNSSGSCVASDNIASPVFRNNCVFGNTKYNYSGYRGIGTGSISVDPLFVNMAGGDYRLQAGSPCINAGYDGVIQAGWLDIDGQPRQNGVVDIGADEYWLFQQIASSGAKGLADGSAVRVAGAVVTAVFGDTFYMEAADRSAGILVHKAGHGMATGQIVSVEGTLATTADEERYVNAFVIAKFGTANIDPLSLNNRTLGGEAWQLSPTGGQKGTKDSVGLNNIGLLIKTTGKVTSVDPASGIFYLDDGSNRMDGSGSVGIRVKAGSLALPTVGQMVTITGISSCYKSGSDLYPLIKLTATPLVLD